MSGVMINWTSYCNGNASALFSLVISIHVVRNFDQLLQTSVRVVSTRGAVYSMTNNISLLQILQNLVVSSWKLVDYFVR